LITRRRLIVALGAGALAAPLNCFAQQQRSNVARIGLLEAGSASSGATWREALIAGLRELGYVEGKNIIIEDRWADGKFERLPALAGELARLGVDVIMPATPPAIYAAEAVSSSIPIVFPLGSDPVETGLVSNLDRPGGNVTGMATMSRLFLSCS